MGITYKNFKKYGNIVDDLFIKTNKFKKEFSYHTRIGSGRYNEIINALDFWSGKLMKYNSKKPRKHNNIL